MDATALRWVLAIIGLLIIGAIYLYSLYQGKKRRDALVKTFTHDEIDSGFIEDDALRAELSSINAMLNEQVIDSDINDIRITPGLEKDDNPVANPDTGSAIELPELVCKLSPEHRIAHILKPLDNHLLTGDEISSACQHTGFQLNDNHHFVMPENPQADFQLLNLSSDGSFQAIDEQQFTARGFVFCINLAACSTPFGCYEIMLKKIDELVRVLDLKVYNQTLDLLTLQHVTDIRKKLLSDESPGIGEESDSKNV